MAKAKKAKRDKTDTAAAGDVRSEEKIIPIGEHEEPSSEKDENRPCEEPAEEILSEVDQLKAQVQQLEDQKLRALAEMDNFRKRSARQIQDTIRHANDRLLREMLDVVDNFERALQHHEEGVQNGANSEAANGDTASGDAVRQGTELIYSQMVDLLARHDVKAIESLGKPFDPNLHEALMPVPTEEYDEGTVAVEIGKGYMLGERVLRHAKVGVSKGLEDNSEQGGEQAPEQS
ncbi:MAG: nucleotide exchange factor GrpE [bacterium]|nr:nucleotide exchange factor GrpE [bacterium]